MRKGSAMKNKIYIRVISLFLVLALTSCGGAKKEITTSPEIVEETQTAETPAVESESDTSSEEDTPIEPSGSSLGAAGTDNENIIPEEAEDPQIDEDLNKGQTEEERIKDEQLNSFSMMYYLAITAEKIRMSKNNRLILDDIYTSLLNDINPGAVDEITQDHLKNLRDIIKAYRNISVKRDRLQYIYNQDKAAAIRSAVPNPLAILSVASSFDWKRLAITAVYTVVDSYNNYKKASENADKAFLMSGWELDDEEVETVQKNRDRAFDYMVDMVQEYHLDGLKTLNEKAIEKFAEICSIESIPERTSRLVAEEETYSLLGNYWLELADCYFQTDKYDKCLECVEKYKDLATGIYRKDYNYVQILPKAIVAAQNTYTGAQYISVIKDYADAIVKNTSTDDWSIRYFVAQVYLDLYARTKDQTYLSSAYTIAHDNVTILLQGQRDLNSTFLADVQEVKAEEPDYRFLTEKEQKEKKKEYEQEKKRVKQYNKTMKKARVTELPSLYEPLILNCELLFALADEMNINDVEKSDIEAILKTNSNGTFLTKPINDAFSFSGSTNKYSINFTKDDIGIPAALLTAGANVTVTVTEDGKSEVYDDCKIQKVVRKDSTIDSFTAYYSSKKLKKHTWTNNSKITVEIQYTDANNRTVTFDLAVVEYKKQWNGVKVIFGEV